MSAQLFHEDIFAFLREVARRCRQPVDAYIIGGAAMAIRGEKRTTKDIDLVLPAGDRADAFLETLDRLDVMVNARGCSVSPRENGRFVIDLFMGRICDGMMLSPTMMGRAELVVSEGVARFYIVSREDVFLLKSVTERDRDLVEMFDLYGRSLDGDRIIDECKVQNGLSDIESPRVYEAFLLKKLDEMEARFEITIPWKRRLRSAAEMGTETTLVLTKVKDGLTTVKEISGSLGLPPGEVRQYLRQLEKDRKISLDKRSRPYRIDPL